MGVSRSGFYKWHKRLANPSNRTKTFVNNLLLFKEYHEKYPSHGYRWLNAKILFDTGQIMSDSYAHKCCKTLGITSKVRRKRYRKPGERYRIYPNLLMAHLNITGPMQCIASDMTAFYSQGQYYELTLYLDLWNNEILAHSLSAKRGDRMTYINGLRQILDLKGVDSKMHTILHSDQGTVYASKAFNELLPAYNIERSMSRAGTPTDNGTIESINGWVKAEMFNDFHITGNEDIYAEIDRYIKFFNEERPAYALDYLTPKQYRELFATY
jgi:transposase InsO family protein